MIIKTHQQRKSLIEFISNCGDHGQIQEYREFILIAIAELLHNLQEDYQAIHNKTYDATKVYTRDLAERLLIVASQYFKATNDNTILASLAKILDGYWELSLILTKTSDFPQKRLEIKEKNQYIEKIESDFSTEVYPIIKYHLLCVKMSLQCYADNNILLADVLNCLPNVTLRAGTADIGVDVDVTNWLINIAPKVFKVIADREDSHIYNQITLLKEVARKLQGCSTLKGDKKRYIYEIISNEIRIILERTNKKILELDPNSSKWETFQSEIDKIFMICYAVIETIIVIIEKLNYSKINPFIQNDLAFFAELGINDRKLRSYLTGIRQIGQMALIKLSSNTFSNTAIPANSQQAAQESVSKLQKNKFLQEEFKKILTTSQPTNKAISNHTLRNVIKELWQSFCKAISIERLLYAPIDIDKFFIDIILSQEENEQDYQIEHRDYLSHTKLVDLFNISSQSTTPSTIKALLIGQPGSGKSTLTDFLVHSAAKDLLWQGYQWVIPIKLANTTIKLYSSTTNNRDQIAIDEEVLNFVIEECIFPFIPKSIELIKENLKKKFYARLIEAKNKKTLLFILDGFDECEQPDNPHPIIKSLLKYPRVIVTSRPGYIPSLNRLGFDNPNCFYVKGFSRRGLENYVLTFFAEENKPALSQALLHQLQIDNVLQKLCCIPLYAEIVCSLTDQEDKALSINDIGSSSSALYNEIEVWMYRRYLLKTTPLQSYNIKQSANQTIEELCARLLKILAYSAYLLKSKTITAPEYQIKGRIKGLILNYLNEVDNDFKQMSLLDRDKEVEKLLETSGFLEITKKGGNTSFNFCHQSLADYFAACFIAKHYAVDRYKKAIKECLLREKDQRSEEQFFWLIAGKLQQEPDLNNFNDFMSTLFSPEKNTPGSNRDYLQLLQLCCSNEAQQLSNNFWELEVKTISYFIKQLIQSYDPRLAIFATPFSFLASRLRLNQWLFSQIYIDKDWVYEIEQSDKSKIRSLLQLIGHVGFASTKLIDALLKLSETQIALQPEVTELLAKLARSSPRVYNDLLIKFLDDNETLHRSKIILSIVSKLPSVDTLIIEKLIDKLIKVLPSSNNELKNLLITCLQSKLNYLVEQLLLHECQLNWQVTLFNDTVERLLKLHYFFQQSVPFSYWQSTWFNRMLHLSSQQNVLQSLTLKLLANINVQALQKTSMIHERPTSYEKELIEKLNQNLKKIEELIVEFLRANNQSDAHEQIVTALQTTASYYQAAFLERAIRKRVDLEKLLTERKWYFENYAPLDLSLDLLLQMPKEAKLNNLVQISQLLCYQADILHKGTKFSQLLNNWLSEFKYELLIAMTNALGIFYQELQHTWLTQWLEYGISSQLDKAFINLPIEPEPPKSSEVINTLITVQRKLNEKPELSKLSGSLKAIPKIKDALLAAKHQDTLLANIWWILFLNHRFNNLNFQLTDADSVVILIEKLKSYLEMLTDSLLSARVKHFQQRFEVSKNAKTTLSQCYSLLDSFKQRNYKNETKTQIKLCCLLIQILVINPPSDMKIILKEMVESDAIDMKLAALKYILLLGDDTYSLADLSQHFRDLWFKAQTSNDNKLLLTLVKLAKLESHLLNELLALTLAPLPENQQNLLFQRYLVISWLNFNECKETLSQLASTYDQKPDKFLCYTLLRSDVLETVLKWWSSVQKSTNTLKLEFSGAFSEAIALYHATNCTPIEEGSILNKEMALETVDRSSLAISSTQQPLLYQGGFTFTSKKSNINHDNIQKINFYKKDNKIIILQYPEEMESEINSLLVSIRKKSRQNISWKDDIAIAEITFNDDQEATTFYEQIASFEKELKRKEIALIK